MFAYVHMHTHDFWRRRSLNLNSDVDAHEKNVNAGSTKSAIMYMVEIIEDRFDIHTLIAMALMWNRQESGAKISYISDGVCEGYVRYMSHGEDTLFCTKTCTHSVTSTRSLRKDLLYIYKWSKGKWWKHLSRLHKAHPVWNWMCSFTVDWAETKKKNRNKQQGHKLSGIYTLILSSQHGLSTSKWFWCPPLSASLFTGYHTMIGEIHKRLH